MMFDVEGFFRAVLEQDEVALRSFFKPDAAVRWHCSNECFTVDEYIRANCEYPGRWLGELERQERVGELIIAAARVWPTDCSASFHVCSFIRLDGGQIAELDEYWADDGPAPDWRREMKLGKAIRLEE